LNDHAQYFPLRHGLNAKAEDHAVKRQAWQQNREVEGEDNEGNMKPAKYEMTHGDTQTASLFLRNSHYLAGI